MVYRNQNRRATPQPRRRRSFLGERGLRRPVEDGPRSRRDSLAKQGHHAEADDVRAGHDPGLINQTVHGRKVRGRQPARKARQAAAHLNVCRKAG